MEKLKWNGSSDQDRIEAIVMGGSSGGIDALMEILPHLPVGYPLPVIIVLHLPSDQPSHLAELFSSKTALIVKEASEKEEILPGTIYFAPPGYHLLIERDRTFSLSTEEQVCFSRPAIDVLFESAADYWGSHVLGVLLSGANQDGAEGLKWIQTLGGIALIQDPKSAQATMMPESASVLIEAQDQQVLTLHQIADFLKKLKGNSQREGNR